MAAIRYRMHLPDCARYLRGAISEMRGLSTGCHRRNAHPGDRPSPLPRPADGPTPIAQHYKEATVTHDQHAERAVVLGEKYADVVIVDRDELIGETSYRNGAPHGRHAHGLVAKGHEIFEGLLPGLTQGMVEDGVRPGDFNGSIRWYFNGLPLARSDSGLPCLPCGRPVLEKHVRQHVQAIDSVRFLTRYDIVGLETTPDHERVTGVRIQRREQGSQPETLLADLVVDVTGRGSRMPAWLRELGYGEPEEDRVKVDLAYTSRHFRLKRDPFTSDILIVSAATPSHPRGAFFYPLPDGETAELSLTGVLGDHAPTDSEGFMAFTKSLPIPDFYEYVHDATPVDAAARFKYPASVWRHYERLTRFPDGLLVMGDAVCSFNPIYAQGMTVSGLEAVTLRKHLHDSDAVSAIDFFAEIAGQIASPWQFSATADLGYPGVEGERTDQVQMINQYITALQAGAVHDPVLTDAFLRVAGMVEEPMSLMQPDIQQRVMQHAGPPPADATIPA
jgi:2-polyprenyl-6-methoxyphenol hydroxylase-like FAD-dependent oxidoreductase